MIELDPPSTALVLIDLQKGILGNALMPITGQELLARGQALAERFRAAKATVVLVNVAFSADGADMLRQRVDQPPALPKGGFPAEWNEFPAGLMQHELLIVKDATTSSVAEGHDMSMKHIHPRLGRLVQGSDLTFTRI